MKKGERGREQFLGLTLKRLAGCGEEMKGQRERESERESDKVRERERFSKCERVCASASVNVHVGMNLYERQKV